MKTIAFFNNKGGVGKTSLCYHLAWMFSQLGVSVLAADLDPQANLTSMFLDDSRLEEIWPDGDHPHTVLGAIRLILKGTGDITDPGVENVNDRLGLISGDLGLSRFEDKLSASWPSCQLEDEAAFRVISSFYRILLQASQNRNADLALIDIGPNLGAINRAALISANYVVVPLAPDLFSLQGLRNLGPTLRTWKKQWEEMKLKSPDLELPLPSGEMKPLGYVVMQHLTRSDRPAKHYGRWIARIPGEYRVSVLSDKEQAFDDVKNDPHCLALLKNYRSLMPMAMEARKPMFHLKPADGAIGSHAQAAAQCSIDFRTLALRIASLVRVSVPGADRSDALASIA